MTIRRRDFLSFASAAALAGALPRIGRAADTARVYDLERFGNARILHMTDTHAQLLPVYFREPSVNLGIGEMRGRPPHLRSDPTAPMPMPSPVWISKNPPCDSASSAASRI
jgi:sulfur-oxidizing protein SoxB